MSAVLPTGPDVGRDAGPGPVHLSAIGTQMAGPSGLRTIMDDVATSIAGDGTAPWLNLSIGNPAPLPQVTAMWRDALANVVSHGFERDVGSYGRSRGSAELVDAAVEYFGARLGWDLTAEHVVVGPGSQMICFAAAALFCGPGAGGPRRIVLPFQPEYTGYQGLCQHADGIVGVAPRMRLTGDHGFTYRIDLDAVAAIDDVGMLLVSSPGNPTGHALSEADVDGLLQIAEDRQVPLVIDHAYGTPFPRVGEVRSRPRLHPRILHCFSASKAGMPGERTGMAIGHPDLTTPIAAFFANSLLHAPQLGQAALAHVLRSGDLDRVSQEVIAPHYRAQRDLVGTCLRESLPEDVRWRRHTDGGMFCWLWFDEPWFDDLELYERMKRKRVFVVPGRHFFTGPSSDGHARRCVRLSLSPDESVLRRGIAVLAETVSQMRDAYDRPHHAD